MLRTIALICLLALASCTKSLDHRRLYECQTGKVKHYAYFSEGERAEFEKSRGCNCSPIKAINW